MTKLYYRESIIEYFESLIFSVEQVPAEIVCVWFDDLYLPCGDSTLYNPGVFKKGLEEFNACFSKKELKVMQEFHHYFESIVDEFDTERKWVEITSDLSFLQLTEKAKKAINVFKLKEKS